MSEQQLLGAVVEAAQRLGWRVMHIPDGLYATAAKEERFDALVGAEGWPDLVLVRGGELIVAELKTERGQLSANQAAWMQAFREVQDERGICVQVWRPHHWSSGAIEEVLR